MTDDTHIHLFWRAEPVHAERVDILKTLKKSDADEIKELGSPAAVQLYISSNYPTNGKERA